ncbi:MAG: imidazole glycerol phosphate synthase subunit HisH [Phycisphaerae bacterium]
MIAVIDHGAADQGALLRALQRAGADAELVHSADRLDRAARIVLYANGSFASLARGLRDRRLIGSLVRAILEGRPFLGVGAGMHMLLDVSYDDGQHTGLGVVPGKAIPIPYDASHPARRVYRPPHQGWAAVRWNENCPLLRGLTSGESFYFEHACLAQPLDAAVTVGRSNYGVDFCAVLALGRTYAVQFLPQQSQEAGQRLLANFAAA